MKFQRKTQFAVYVRKTVAIYDAILFRIYWKDLKREEIAQTRHFDALTLLSVPFCAKKKTIFQYQAPNCVF